MSPNGRFTFYYSPYNHTDVNISNAGHTAARWWNTGARYATTLIGPSILKNEVVNITLMMTNKSSSISIYAGVVLPNDKFDFNNFIGGSANCDGWSYDFDLGWRTNCSGYKEWGWSVSRTYQNFTMWLNWTDGTLWFPSKNETSTELTNKTQQPAFKNVTLSNSGANEVYFAVTLKNLGDEVYLY